MLRRLKRALFGPNGRAENARQEPVKQQAYTGHANPDTPSTGLPGLELAEDVRILQRDEHSVSRRDISPNALKVLYRLNDAGFHAFLVGGGVRDLLLGGQPKDFDVSTDATPEEIRKLFRNSRIIGRRFKIVHIRFGREIIEVTTFRAHHRPEEGPGDNDSARSVRDLDSAHSDDGMILRDNVYGDIHEDALRRDFSVNALYYTTRGFVVLDFANGNEDLKDRRLRIIGDPEMRYREDPVRLLRAIRFAAKLDFTMDAKTRDAIDPLSSLLASVSPARLFDESLKLLVNGKAEQTYALLSQFEVAKYLFRATLEATRDPEQPSSRLVILALRNTDERINAGKSITPAFLYAALLWPPLLKTLSRHGVNGRPSQPVLQEAANEVISEQLQRTAIPRRFTSAMREIWELQWRLQSKSRRRVMSVFQHPRFRAAYDFLLLREEAGELPGGTGQWWTDFQENDSAGQERMLQSLDKSAPGKRRKRRKRRRQSNE